MVVNSLDEWCEEMLTCCKSNSIHSSAPIMASFATTFSENSKTFNKFWNDISFKGAWCKYEIGEKGMVGDSVSLGQLVGYSYALCELIYPYYKKLCGSIKEIIMNRAVDVGDSIDDGDCVIDGGNGGVVVPDVEAYLRRLYLCLKAQGMVSANECILSSYFGCRQQCLYGCLCFCLLVFDLFHGDRINMPGIDWVNHVVMDGGCGRLRSDFVTGLGLNERVLLGYVSEYAMKKPIVNCVFDIVNTKNPSGGMIGPRNCQWLPNTLLFLSGTVSPNTQKLLKNHAAVHDACGFMLNHTDIGSGYGFGYFPHNVVNVSSAGASRNGVLWWFLSCSGIGQVSGWLL